MYVLCKADDGDGRNLNNGLAFISFFFSFILDSNRNSIRADALPNAARAAD